MGALTAIRRDALEFCTRPFLSKSGGAGAAQDLPACPCCTHWGAELSTPADSDDGPIARAVGRRHARWHGVCGRRAPNSPIQANVSVHRSCCGRLGVVPPGPVTGSAHGHPPAQGDLVRLCAAAPDITIRAGARDVVRVEWAAVEGCDVAPLVVEQVHVPRPDGGAMAVVPVHHALGARRLVPAADHEGRVDVARCAPIVRRRPDHVPDDLLHGVPAGCAVRDDADAAAAAGRAADAARGQGRERQVAAAVGVVPDAALHAVARAARGPEALAPREGAVDVEEAEAVAALALRGGVRKVFAPVAAALAPRSADGNGAVAISAGAAASDSAKSCGAIGLPKSSTDCSAAFALGTSGTSAAAAASDLAKSGGAIGSPKPSALGSAAFAFGASAAAAASGCETAAPRRRRTLPPPLAPAKIAAP
eukprot:CAMPEP_0176315706 /NCGR_PEP_ID=MMETSP0121_2-20121125/68344_1 /TAXON_ID=160619 /ORGANISM="Kryptoperidinium foliaceum, Strain CCMP 1326" /LENGTH=420 /DNA_ID=CAMNT_0017657871 /DNA_START=129 /DNA_END=1389 /DNA_ORIENTATION=+